MLVLLFVRNRSILDNMIAGETPASADSWALLPCQDSIRYLECKERRTISNFRVRYTPETIHTEHKDHA